MRYMVNDGMRAIDYLTSRADVDRSHIGALGCSGGGTATAVLAALDDRVAAAGTACYITSWQELLSSATGVQEAEQSIPHFIEAGLDFADWVEAAAPRPYAIISTTADMFPFEGARQSYNEARRIYGLYGAADRNAKDRLQWITGPGGHGNLGPISPAILSFFAKYLKGDTAEQQFIPARPANPDDLRCTPTGQVATSLGGETVWSLNRKRIPARQPEDIEHLRANIRTLAGITWRPGGKAPALPEGMQIFPTAGAGSSFSFLWLDSASATENPDKRGYFTAVMPPTPWPPGTESIKSPYLGPFNLLSLRAFLVGRTLVGIRTDDALQAVDWIFANVHPSSLTIHAKGALGMAALLAAVLDSRIGAVEVDHPATSYRSIVDMPLHRDASEIVIPGVLKNFDVPDLLRAIAPRQVVVMPPEDGAVKQVVK
jgi:hypothetical protein